MKALPDRIVKRIYAIKNKGTHEIIIQNRSIGYSYLNRCVDINDDHTKFSIRANGMFIIDEFFCYAGVCVHPQLSLSAHGSKEVIEAWKWFIAQVGVEPVTFTNAVEKASIASYIFGATTTSIPYKILGLAVDLHRLYQKDVNISPKIKMLRNSIQSHVRKSNKESIDILGLQKVAYLAKYLNNIASEIKLALIALLLGNKIRIGESPDLYIDGIAVEVKHPERANRSNIQNAVERGLDKANFVAINSAVFKKAWLNDYKVKPLAQTALSSALDTAIKLVKNNQRCLLFYDIKYADYKVGYVGQVVIIRK